MDSTNNMATPPSAPPLRQERALSSEMMEHLLEHMLNGVAYCEMLYDKGHAVDFLYLYTNPSFHRQTGIGPVIGKRISEVIPGLRESDSRLFEIYDRVAKGGAPETFEIYVTALQQWLSVSVYCPAPGHFVALFNVITERKEFEMAVQERATQLQFVLEGSELGFWDWNIRAGTVDRNAQWAHMLGYTHEEIQHTTQQWADFVHPDDRDAAWASIWSVVEGRSAAHKMEYRMLHKDGSMRWILDQAKIMQRDSDGKPIRMCGTHTDVTARKLLEEELTRQAHVDFLTGVFNRRHFMDRADQELQRSLRYGSPLSLLMLDIDYFKAINDQYGHKVGDTVLQALTEVCRATMRSADILGRIGGEEFTVLMPETDCDVAVEAANRLRTALEEAKVPQENGPPVQFKVSVGVSSLASPKETMDILLQRADTALYEAKRTGRNRVCVAQN